MILLSDSSVLKKTSKMDFHCVLKQSFHRTVWLIWFLQIIDFTVFVKFNPLFEFNLSKKIVKFWERTKLHKHIPSFRNKASKAFHVKDLQMIGNSFYLKFLLKRSFVYQTVCYKFASNVEEMIRCKKFEVPNHSVHRTIFCFR